MAEPSARGAWGSVCPLPGEVAEDSNSMCAEEGSEGSVEVDVDDGPWTGALDSDGGGSEAVGSSNWGSLVKAPATGSKRLISGIDACWFTPAGPPANPKATMGGAASSSDTLTPATELVSSELSRYAQIIVHWFNHKSTLRCACHSSTHGAHYNVHPGRPSSGSYFPSNWILWHFSRLMPLFVSVIFDCTGAHYNVHCKTNHFL